MRTRRIFQAPPRNIFGAMRRPILDRLLRPFPALFATNCALVAVTALLAIAFCVDNRAQPPLGVAAASAGVPAIEEGAASPMSESMHSPEISARFGSPPERRARDGAASRLPLVTITAVIAAGLVFGTLSARAIARNDDDGSRAASAAGSDSAVARDSDATHALDGDAAIATDAAMARAIALAARELVFVTAASLPPGATHAILRTDPDTGGIERFIRFPAWLEIAEHWHSASETIVLLEGNATLAIEGERDVLTPGSYSFIPARTVHEAWIGPAGAVVYQRMGRAPDRHLVSEEGWPK